MGSVNREKKKKINKVCVNEQVPSVDNEGSLLLGPSQVPMEWVSMFPYEA